MVLRRFDSDHDGRISFEEYVTMICGGAWTLAGPSVFALTPKSHEIDCSLELCGAEKDLFQEIQNCANSIELCCLEEMRAVQAPAGAIKELQVRWRRQVQYRRERDGQWSRREW